VSGIAWKTQLFDASRQWPIARAHDNAATAILAEEAAGGGRQPPVRIDDDPGRIAAGYVADIEQGVIGGNSAHAYDDRIDGRTYAVHMNERRLPVYPAALSALDGDPPVEGLAELGNDEGAIAGCGKYPRDWGEHWLARALEGRGGRAC
jgi:hypothetical protein